MSDIKVLVNGLNGPELSSDVIVDGEPINGLAVTMNTRLSDNRESYCWSVTHVASGYAVVQWKSLDTARRCLDYLTRCLDWSDIPVPCPGSYEHAKRVKALLREEWYLVADDEPEEDDDCSSCSSLRDQIATLTRQLAEMDKEASVQRERANGLEYACECAEKQRDAMRGALREIAERGCSLFLNAVPRRKTPPYCCDDDELCDGCLARRALGAL